MKAIKLKTGTGFIFALASALVFAVSCGISEGPSLVDSPSLTLDPNGIKQMAIGQGFSCALSNSGKVKCWGSSPYTGQGNGQAIGDNETLVNLPNVDLGDTATQISAAHTHVCALLSSGDVRCWGGSSNGQLGLGNTLSIGDNEVPSSVNPVDLNGVKVTQVSAGGFHTCALLTTKKVRCWGRNDEGQLGYGNTNDIGDDESPNTLGDINVGGDVQLVVAGGLHTCVILTTGDVKCWGKNNSGQLGYGNTTQIGDNELPSSVGTVSLGGPAKTLSSGSGDFTCAIMVSGDLRCWGENSNGQLGLSSTTSIGDNELPSSASAINLGGSIAQIAAGRVQTCAVMSSGDLRCWGGNGTGSLGLGNTSNVGDNELPLAVGPVGIDGVAVGVATGNVHNCVFLKSGRLRCFGSNFGGQLGLGNTNNLGDDELPNTVADIGLTF